MSRTQLYLIHHSLFSSSTGCRAAAPVHLSVARWYTASREPRPQRVTAVQFNDAVDASPSLSVAVTATSPRQYAHARGCHLVRVVMWNMPRRCCVHDWEWQTAPCRAGVAQAPALS